MLGSMFLGAGAIVTAWFAARWLGRGRPCPVLVAALFDNRLAAKFSGVATILRRADIRPDMRVLDAGCGPGRITLALARLVGPAGEVVALDLQEGMLDRVRAGAAREGITNVRTVRRALGLDSAEDDLGPFDRVLLVTVLGEIPEPVSALRWIRSVLKPDGILSVTEMIADPDYVTRDRLRALTAEAAFVEERTYGSPILRTTNFIPAR